MEQHDVQNDVRAEAHHYHPGSVIRGLLFGTLIGAGVGLLLAPASGQDTRQMLRDRALAARNQALEAAEDARSRAEAMQNAGREMLEDNKRRILRTAEAAKQSAQAAWTSQGKNGEVSGGQSHAGQVMLSHGARDPLGQTNSPSARSGPSSTL